MTSKNIQPIDPPEPLTRYIFSKNHFKGDRVLHAAFMPYKGEVSIFRIQGWSALEIWNNGLEIGQNREPSLKGRGDFILGDLEKILVKIYPDPYPSKHANIRDFPEKREDIQEQATILAKASLFKKFSSDH